MRAVTILLELLQRGIRVDLVGDRIRCRHAPGVLSAELASRVRAHRREIMALLADPNALRLAAAEAIFGAHEGERIKAVAPTVEQAVPVRCWACGLERIETTYPCPCCHPPACLPTERRSR